jgi:choline dehydrogenase-like flavoprotein
MLIDGSLLPTGCVLEADICVIGSGIAGITLAREFDGLARRVIILEGGGLEGTLGSSLYRGDIAGHPYFNLEESRSRGFGGSANCWGGFCRMFDPLDFETRAAIPESGWPLSFEELLPYYEKAHRICGVHSMDYSLQHWRQIAPYLSDIFMGEEVESEVLQKSTFCGQTYRDELSASKNVRVYYNATVTNLVFVGEEQRCIEQVDVKSSPEAGFHVRAQLFILASGGIENARLLLASNMGAPGGLDNQHDLVGRYFMEHISVRVGMFHPAIQDLQQRYFPHWHETEAGTIKSSVILSKQIRRREQLLRCFFELSPKASHAVHGRKALAYLRRQVRKRRKVHNLAYHLRNIIVDGRYLLRETPERRRHSRPGPQQQPFPLTVSAEQAPNPQSRVVLSRHTDALGVPRARLEWKISELDLDHIERSVQIFSAEARRSGLGYVAVSPRWRWPVWGHHHHIGTTRMHDDPSHGVVDRHCRLHGVANLYVAGSSVFPTAGAGTVTLLITALSVRLAEHLLRDARQRILSCVDSATAAAVKP